MRTRSSLLFVSALALVSCTSLLGTFEVSDQPSGTGDDGGGGDTGPACTQCGDQCVDLQTSTLNCGECGLACTGGQICNAAKCECAEDKAFCEGTCVVANRQRCGAACSTCAADQICSKGCVQAPPAAFDETPRNPTGWVDAANKPLTFKIKPVQAPGTAYECRSYSVYDAGGAPRAITPTNPPFKACDGAGGTGLEYKPTEDTLVPQGSYRAEMRYRSDSFLSEPVKFDFYVHHKLDKVPTCPRPNVPADGPIFSDDQYFAAALAFQQKTSQFDLTQSFPVPGDDLAASPMVIKNPFLKVPFKNAQRFAHNASWAASQFFDVTLYERSLRHQYTMNPTRTMLLIKRQYEAPARTSFGTYIPGARKSGEKDCRNLVKIGNKYSAQVGPDGFNRGKKYIQCDALVMNSRGAALCMGPNPGKTAPEPQLVDTSADQGSAPYGTLSGAHAAAQTTITVTGINFNSPAANAAVGKYVQIPNKTGKWYKITAVSSNTQATITPGLVSAVAAGSQVRYSYQASPALAQRYVIPTGYAKLLEKNKGAQSLTGFPSAQPSYGTKCTSSPGCADGTNYLTYLPP